MVMTISPAAKELQVSGQNETQAHRHRCAGKDIHQRSNFALKQAAKCNILRGTAN
jgi:hypothetical protein